MEEVSNPLDLLSTNMCSPIVVFIIIAILSIISLYISRGTLKRYNNHKMENLYNLYSAQELKFLLVLGVTMYGLCQYNKTELAWIFLIFPVIYIVLQNVLLFIHVSSGLQNAPAESPTFQGYGGGMNAPLLGGQGPSPPQISTDEKPVATPPPPQQEFTLPKMTNQSSSMGSPGFGSLMGSNEPSGYSL